MSRKNFNEKNTLKKIKRCSGHKLSKLLDFATVWLSGFCRPTINTFVTIFNVCIEATKKTDWQIDDGYLIYRYLQIK